MAFHPYLYFAGNCRDAMTRYHEIFGGDLVVMDGTDVPPDAGIPAGKDHLVMHASVKIGDDLVMASDSYDDGFAPSASQFVHWVTTDADQAKSVFADLADGGEVLMEGPQFWTSFYGQCIDSFGTGWQVSVEDPIEG